MSHEAEGTWCQCEHASHFTDEIVRPVFPTIHYYGKHFLPSELSEVKTLYGKFRVCPTCKETCMKGVPSE